VTQRIRFIIFGQSRSGSTLLVEILNCHPQIRCDGELFRHAQWQDKRHMARVKQFPFPWVVRRARAAGSDGYGFKLFLYHLPRMRLALGGFALLGWKLIHLYRENSVEQALSRILAAKRQLFHVRGDAESPDQARPVRIEVNHFASVLDNRRVWTARERQLIDRHEHLDLCYERDLADSANWQQTADRIATFLGVERFQPQGIPLRRVVQRPYGELIENYAELESYLENEGLGLARA
jgi:LPS sulfotransferase NodH